MKFGLFYEIANFKESRKTESQVYEEVLEECEVADRGGYNHIWAVEHHFMTEYSYSPSPEVFLSAVSQRTRKCRIGTGVILLPFHNPVNVAERTAVLDILSKGRLDVGTGRGFQPVEYETYGLNMENSKAMWEEGLDLLRKAWTQDGLTYNGRFWKIPKKINVLPKPVQKPHPPLWIASLTPSTFEHAARNDMGCLAGLFKPLPLCVEDLKLYQKTRRDAGKGPEGDRFYMLTGMYVHKNNETAKKMARDEMAKYFQLLLKFIAPVLAKTPSAYGYYSTLAKEVAAKYKYTMEELEKTGLIVAGDPPHVIQQLEALEELGFPGVMHFAPVGLVGQEAILESIQLTCDEVIPHFAK